MVKFVYTLIALIFCTPIFAQNLSLGMGGTGNFSRVGFNETFNFDVLTLSGDTLLLSAKNATIEKSVSLPIYARFTSKKNWWVQANYGFETWRFGLDAQTTHTPYEIQRRVNERLANSWTMYTGELDSVAFRNEFGDVYTQNEEDNSKKDIRSFERVQYNRLSLTIGSVLNRKAAIKFYYGIGADLMMTSTFESYQGLVYDSDEVAYQNEILDAFPKLQSFQLAPTFNFGLERQNLRIGLDFTFYPFAIYGAHESSLNNVTQSNDNLTQLISNIRTFGVHLNYTFFNQNFNQQIDPERQAEFDPIVIGRYRQKPKLFQFGAKIDFPSLHNSGWSVLDDYNLEDENDILNVKLDAENDTYLTGLNIEAEDGINDYIYIEKNDEDIFINEDGDLDTNRIFTTLFFDSGNINTILKSPKFSGFIRLNLHELFSLDLNLGYQNQTYGIVAYETKNASAVDEELSLTRRLLYQENFHEISLGINAYYQYRLNNISQIGCHIGLNANTWVPGLFIIEQGGINDAELLEDFHEYLIEQDDAEEWNTNLNPDGDKGLFSKADYYNYTYESGSDIAQQNSYHTDFRDYLLDTPLKRSFFEVRMGIDYYIENLKFSVYGEHSVWKQKFLYNNLLSIGLSVSMFIY